MNFEILVLKNLFKSSIYIIAFFCILFTMLKRGLNLDPINLSLAPRVSAVLLPLMLSLPGTHNITRVTLLRLFLRLLSLFRFDWYLHSQFMGNLVLGGQLGYSV